MRNITLLLFIIAPCWVYSQNNLGNLRFQVGTAFNASPGPDEAKSTSGVGLFLASDFTVKDKIRFGLRFEPTALAWGVALLPDACGGACKEGASYLLSNYLTADYLVGKPKYGTQNGKHQGYFGVNLLMLTHRRYQISDKDPDNWVTTKRTVTNLGVGMRAGFLLGRFDLSASYNRVDIDFQDYFGFNLGYTVWHR